MQAFQLWNLWKSLLSYQLFPIRSSLSMMFIVNGQSFEAHEINTGFPPRLSLWSYTLSALY